MAEQASRPASAPPQSGRSSDDEHGLVRDPRALSRGPWIVRRPADRADRRGDRADRPDIGPSRLDWLSTDAARRDHRTCRAPGPSLGAEDCDTEEVDETWLVAPRRASASTGSPGSLDPASVVLARRVAPTDPALRPASLSRSAVESRRPALTRPTRRPPRSVRRRPTAVVDRPSESHQIPDLHRPGARLMIRFIILWSLHNRLLVLAGGPRADRRRHPLGPRTERRGLSRPDAAAGRGHHPEPRVQPRGDGTTRRHPDRDRPERDAGPGGPPEHLGRRPERHQVPVRLRDRLLVGPPGGHQPDRLRRQPSAGRPRRGSRPGARPARSSDTSSKGRVTRPTSSRPSRTGCSSGP